MLKNKLWTSCLPLVRLVDSGGQAWVSYKELRVYDEEIESCLGGVKEKLAFPAAMYKVAPYAMSGFELVYSEKAVARFKELVTGNVRLSARVSSFPV